MAEIFLKRFAVKRIEKITVRLKSLTVGVNSKRAGARLGKCRGGGGLLYPPQRQLLGGCLQKLPETRAFDFDKNVNPNLAKQLYSL